MGSRESGSPPSGGFRGLGLLVLLLAALGWWAFFQFAYCYHFFYQEQNQLFLLEAEYLATYLTRLGGLAALVGDFLTQFYYYLYAGAAILSLWLLALGWLVYQALRNFRLCRWLSLAVAVAAMSMAALSQLAHQNRLEAVVSLTGWAFVAWLLGKLPLKLGWVCLPIGWVCLGVPQIKKLAGPEMVLEKTLAVDTEYYFHHYDRVTSLIEQAESWTDEMLFFYNLVQAQRGALAEHLLDYYPNNLGTFHNIGPETPLITIRNMNELYWVLGDMTFTERAAMMGSVFSREGRNVRMIRRLAETNLVSGDSLAAEKYLRLLDKTLVYRGWAETLRTRGRDIYRQKIALVSHRDTITTSDNAHFLMMQLLDAHPENTVALDYLLCSDLLLKDITSFKRDYDRYCTGDSLPARPSFQQKKLYQEALCIWLAGSKATQEDWERYIKRSDVMKRFIEYNGQRGSARFSDTYWYYFDKRKAPEI